MVGIAGERSRTVDWQQIVAAAPEVLLIACCGFDIERTLADLPILRSYPGWSDLPCVRSKRVYVVDGSAYFSRPGPRLVDSLEILAHALDPENSPAASRPSRRSASHSTAAIIQQSREVIRAENRSPIMEPRIDYEHASPLALKAMYNLQGAVNRRDWKRRSTNSSNCGPRRSTAAPTASTCTSKTPRPTARATNG